MTTREKTKSLYATTARHPDNVKVLNEIGSEMMMKTCDTNAKDCVATGLSLAAKIAALGKGR
ncbi:MAG: hypothetical protein H0U46_11865 [Actinobacteria bacterium]|nr:hypothetical protein [Actinomycetota bacterium]